MNTLRTPTLIAAGLGGLLWTVKVLVITAGDASFDPLESYVFIGGLLAILTAAVLVAIDVTRQRRGLVRVAAAAATAIGIVAGMLVLESLGKAAVAALASGDNLGLEQEGGILCCGLAWLAFAAWSASARRSVTNAVAAT